MSDEFLARKGDLTGHYFRSPTGVRFRAIGDERCVKRETMNGKGMEVWIPLSTVTEVPAQPGEIPVPGGAGICTHPPPDVNATGYDWRTDVHGCGRLINMAPRGHEAYFCDRTCGHEGPCFSGAKVKP